MAYTALYRKFRPSGFEDVKGQEHIVTTLRNQISSGRTSHAYLFCGTRGTGKTTIAKILARAVNCEHPIEGSPCGECAVCRSIQDGTSMNVIEIDAASNNGVDNIREIVEEVQYSPTEGKFKVYIIDEVHMLSTGAFNALLKTLEEPPSYVMFILATTEPHKIPITILSRCQRYDFRRITIETIQARLQELMEKEGVEAEEKALRYIAKAADGSMRDGLSLLDQCIAFYFNQTLTYDKVLDVLGAVDVQVYDDMFQAVLGQDVVRDMEIIEQMVVSGRDLPQFITEFIWYLRNILLVQSSENGLDMIDVSSEQVHLLKDKAAQVDAQTLLRYIQVLSELSGQLRYAVQKRVLIEVAIVKLVRPQMDGEQTVASLNQRVEQLEKQLEQGIPTAASSPAVPAPAVPKEEKKPIDGKAVTEDIKKIIQNWDEVMSHILVSSRHILSGATRVPGPDGSLELIFGDETSAEYFSEESEALHALREALEQYVEKQVPIRVRCMKKQKKDLYQDLGEFLNITDSDVTVEVK